MSRSAFTSTDPYTGITFASYDKLSDTDVDNILERQYLVNSNLSSIGQEQRAGFIHSLGKHLKTARVELAHLITREMGKPITQAFAEIDKCIWLCRYAVEELLDTYAHSKSLELDKARVLLRHSPLGTVLGIMPWNFPIWQTLRFAVPAILNGNPVFLKPAPNVIGSSKVLERCMHQACSSADFFRLLIVDVERVEQVVSHRSIGAVTLTGSSRAGRAVAALAGKHLKPSVLELGGSDPFIVLDDADVSSAAKAYVDSRMNNTGQTCIAAKRAIVHRSLIEEFMREAADYLSSKKLGEPTDEHCDISCIARSDLSEALDNQLIKSLDGTDIIVESKRVEGSNVFVPGLYRVRDFSVPLWQEEVFGPIGVITDFRTNPEAIQLANDSHYGLGCSIWSDNISRAIDVADSIHAGSIHINRIVSSDPRVPFGGVGESGYGRELGEHGFRELTNLKTITYPSDS